MNELNLIASLQSALDAHIERMVEARVSALAAQVAALTDRVAALEQAAAQPAPVEQAIPADPLVISKSVDHFLDTSEDFWSRVGRFVEGKIEQAVAEGVEAALDDHTGTYDHDEYDAVVSEWGNEETCDFVKEGDLSDQIEEKVRDVLNNATLSISL